MADIPIGSSGEMTLTVSDKDAISFLGTEDTRVLATPWLIAYLETVARNTVKPFLLDEEDTVGTQVNVRHLAAAPIGINVRFEARVTAIQGRRVQFDVTAWDDKEKIGEGTHERAIIHIGRFGERVRAKKLSVGSLSGQIQQ